MRRHDSDRALSLWEGLVQGRWSLLDRFDTDGRRYIIAVRNDPQLGDPRGLTSYELQVAELIGLGRPRKEIAFMLGVSPSAINNAVQRVTRKLGLSSVSDAAMFFSPNGLRARLKRVDIAGDAFLVGSYGDVGVSRLARLTEAERDVALRLLSGATNESIARARGSTVNTIANQIKSVFEKFGVNNRAELAAVLSSEEAGAGPDPPDSLG
jgi:DNA-binding CsgD family transcriptional regulator